MRLCVINIARVAIMFFAFCLTAYADGKCEHIKSSRWKKICSEQHRSANSANPLVVNKPVSKPLAGVLNIGAPWALSKVRSPITDTINVTLSKAANESAKVGYRTIKPVLFARCKEGVTELYVYWNAYLGLNTTTMMMRFDSLQAFNITWNISTDTKAVFYGGNSIMMLRNIMRAKRLYVQVTPYNQNPVGVTFDVSELQKSIVPLKTACRW